MPRSLLLPVHVVLVLSCAVPDRRAPEPAPVTAEPAAAEPAAVATPRVHFVAAAPTGDVAAEIARFVAATRAEGREPLVYVGATWCEPCGYFHRAAEAGELDTELPALSLLEFDLDRDQDRLAVAGYASRMIPLFVVPETDGRPSPHRIEGSIHGPGSPAQIVPRLLEILAARSPGAP
jgi:hypothetical protein